MPYAIRLPDGTLVQNIPDELDPAEAKRRIIAAGLIKEAPPETTFLGQLKEAGKGLIPGAVGLVEQAAIGASALLPEDYEKAAREKIAGIAGAAKAPFAAAPGYEETVGRKIGEAVGSTVPFLAAGPLGLVGRVGAVGLGVGAGAGEARTRAEREGATAEQRATATALGIAPGALEVFAPFRILSRIPEGEVLTAVQQVKRALVAGGEEAAQEAASGLAQNMISKGIYKPEQELIEGLGEQAAYGGATGAIVQGLLDLAIGRRARGPAPAGEETPIEKARREAEAAAAAAPPAEEPAVRKPGEPKPLPDTLDSETIKTIGFSRGKVHDALLGKALTDPEVRTVLEEYKQRPNASAKTAAKIDAFLARLPEAEPVAPPPVGEAPTPPTAPPVETPAGGAPAPAPITPAPAPVEGREDYWRPNPYDPENKNTWQDTFGFIHYDVNYNLPSGGRVKDLVEAAQSNEIQLRFVNSKGEEKILSVYAAKGKKPYWRGAGIMTDAQIEAGLGNELYNAIGNEKLETEADYDALFSKLRSILTKPEAPSVPTEPTEPEAGRAGPGVAGGPPAVSTAPRPGEAEPDGVVPPAADVGQPPRREAAEPPAVAAEPSAFGAITETIDKAKRPAEAADLDAWSAQRDELRSQRERLNDDIQDLTDAQDALKTRGGVIPAGRKAAYDDAQEKIDALKLQRDALDQQLTELQKSKPKAVKPEKVEPIKATDRGISYFADPEEAAADLEREIDEAVGAYNNPKSDLKRRQVSTDFLFRLAKDKTVPEEIQTRAKEALAFAVDPRDLRDNQRDDYAALIKDVPDTGRGWEQLRYQEARFGPVDLAESQTMDDALRGKSFSEAIDFAIKNARDDIDRAIMVKAKRRADELAAKGVEFSFGLTPKGKVLIGKLGRAKITYSGLGDSTKVDVLINGATTDPNDTLSQDTLAHEIVHAVTMAQVRFAPQGSAAVKLRQLREELVEIYNERYNNKTLTEEEKQYGPVFLEDANELLAYGLTNGKAQNWLASIKDPSGGTFLSRLFKIVSQVLNLKGAENSALARLMTISEEIFDESIEPYIAEANRQGLSLGKQANVTGVPSWALEQASGLKVVWHQGNVALIETRAINGKTIYLGAKKDFGRTRVDIRSYSGKDFTPAELAAMKQAADALTPQVAPRREVIGERKRRTLTEKLGQDYKGNKALRIRQKFADSMAPVDDLFTNAYGGKVRDRMGNLNPMVLLSRALDALRISKAVQEQGGLSKVDGLWVADKLVDADGREVSYVGVLSRIADAAKKAGRTYNDFAKELGTLLVAHREYNLREKNKTLDKGDQITLFFDDPTLDSLEAQFQGDDFAKGVLKDLDTIRFNLIDALVASGRISEKQAQEYKDATGYVPFERIGEFENNYASTSGSNRGVAALKKMRSLEGSKRQTVNPVENFSKLVDWATKETMKNEAAGRALDDMALLGTAKKVASADAVAKDAEGAVVQVYKDGAPAFYYVLDPAHVPTFSMIDRKVPDTFKLMQKGSQILRAGVTGMPPFAVKQIFDDIVRAYTYGGVQNNAELVKRVMTNFPKNWFNEVFKRKTASAKKMESLGIVGTFDFSQTGNLQNILEQAGAEKESLGRAIMRVMEAGAKASDLAVRQAIYEQVMKETGDTVAAESAAREIINFSRRGTSETMNLLISVIPFFNAYARGMDKLAVAAAGNMVGKSVGTARAMFYKRMGVLTAMGFAYALAMQDDDEYQSLPDHVRDTNWVLPGGKYLGFVPVIPIPAELAFFFKAIPERVVQYMKYQGTDEERAMIDLLGQMVSRGVDVFSSPNLTPQILRPMLENLINYSFFLGRPLESQAQQALEPYLREGMGTSDAMKAVAKIINDFAESTGVESLKISPIKLENLVRGMMGTGAGLALSMTDAMVNPSRTDRPLHQQLTPQLTGASALMKDAVGTRMMDEIYKLERSTEQAYNSMNRLMKNKPEEVDAYVAQNRGMLGIRPAVKAVLDDIRALNEQARLIDKDTSISSEERRKLINGLRAEQNEIAKIVYSLRKDARDIQLGL